jgi:hypothetical protein
MVDHFVAGGSADRQTASEAGMDLAFTGSRVALDLLLQRSGCRREQEAEHLRGSSGHSAAVRLKSAAATRTEAVIRERSLRAQMLVDRNDRSVLSDTESGKHATSDEWTDAVRADERARLLLPLRAQQVGGEGRSSERGRGKL